MRIEFFVPGVAQPKGSTKAFMPKGARFPVVTSDNPKLKSWESRVATFAAPHFSGPFVGRVSLTLQFFLPRPKSLSKKVTDHVRKPDLSKLYRATEDGLIGIAFVDDNQVAHACVTKQYAELGQEGCRVIVSTDGQSGSV